MLYDEVSGVHLLVVEDVPDRVDETGKEQTAGSQRLFDFAQNLCVLRNVFQHVQQKGHVPDIAVTAVSDEKTITVGITENAKGAPWYVSLNHVSKKNSPKTRGSLFDPGPLRADRFLSLDDGR